VAASTERTIPSVNSFTLPDTLPAVLLANPGACVTGASGLGHTDRAVERHRRRVASRCPFPPIPVRSSVPPSDATRVARCAGGSSQTGAASRDSRSVGAWSTGHVARDARALGADGNRSGSTGIPHPAVFQRYLLAADQEAGCLRIVAGAGFEPATFGLWEDPAPGNYADLRTPAWQIVASRRMERNPRATGKL